MDYFSRYMEVQKLTSTTLASIIATLKTVFSRHGIPVALVTDNGPQFASAEMNQFLVLLMSLAPPTIIKQTNWLKGLLGPSNAEEIFRSLPCFAQL